MQDEIFELQRMMESLYDFQFQVIPFRYVHMISFSNALYLCCYAAIKGLMFQQAAAASRAPRRAPLEQPFRGTTKSRARPPCARRAARRTRTGRSASSSRSGRSC